MTGPDPGDPVFFAGHRFDIQVDDSFRATQLAHLRAFLPALDHASACPHRPARISVRHSRDVFADRLARLEDLTALTVTPFRGEPYRFSRIGDVSWWRPHPGSHLAQDHLYARDASGRVHVLVHPGAERGERYLARVVREGVLRCAEDRGWTVFHAAAAAPEGRGVLIAGQSGAGKTTVLTALAAHARADLIASDRAAVTDGARVVVGVPLSVRIAAGTLSALPATWPLTHHQAPAAGLDAAAKTAKTPADFARAFAVTLRESAPLRAVVLPQLTDDDRPPATHLLDGDMARAHLAAACCTPRDEDWLHPWFSDRNRTLEELGHQAAGLIGELAARVPVIYMTAGIRTGHLLERIADTITRRLP